MDNRFPVITRAFSLLAVGFMLLASILSAGVCATPAIVDEAGKAAHPAPFVDGTVPVRTAKQPMTVQLTSPNGGEQVQAGEYYNITWFTTGGSTPINVMLRYSIDGRGGAQFLIGSSLPNDGFYLWLVPNSPSTHCFVNITVTDSSAPQEGAMDDSDNEFEIKALPLGVNVLTPNGSENWTAGNNEMISWNTTGGYGTLKTTLEYSTDGGTSYSLIKADVLGTSYSWTVPDPGSIKYNCKVRATLKDNSNPPQQVVDQTDGYFMIYILPPTIILQNPYSGVFWNAGTTQSITWMISGGKPPYSDVTIEYSTTGKSGYTALTTSATGGSYPWKLPVLAQTSGDCYVRVSVQDSNLQSTSAENLQPFTIYVSDPPTVSLIQPNSGENWGANTTQYIQWSYSGGMEPLKMNLSYSTQGAAGPFVSIATDVNGTDGSYTWVVPYKISSNCYVKIVLRDSYGNGRQAEDTSDVAFSIYPMPPKIDLKIVSPAGGEKWSVGYSYDIKWSRSGGKWPFTTKIDFSIDGTTNYQEIVANTTDNGTHGAYKWTVPDKASTNCYIRIMVTGEMQQSATDVSAKFEISGDILPKPGSADGTVQYDDGRPVPNATVSVVDSPSLKATTNQNGYFIIHSIPAGTHSLRVVKTGYPEKIVGVTVQSGLTASAGTIVLTQTIDHPTNWLPIIIAIVVLIVLAAFMAMIFSKWNKKKQAEKDAVQQQVWVYPTPTYDYQQASPAPGAPFPVEAPRGSGTLPTARTVVRADDRPMDKEAELKRLDSMKTKGFISEDEYQYSRKGVLGLREEPKPVAPPEKPADEKASETADVKPAAGAGEGKTDEKTQDVEEYPPLEEDTPDASGETAPEPEAEEKTQAEIDADESGDLVALALAKAARVTGAKEDGEPEKEDKPERADKKETEKKEDE